MKPGSQNQSTTQQIAPAPQQEEPDTPYVPPAFEAVDHHQANGNDNRNGSSGFTGGRGQDRGQDRDDVSMNNEPFGSGIKEDG